MTRIRDGLSNITANLGNNNYVPPQLSKVGKVYAVILDPSSVPAKVWDDNGGWAGVGTILYEEYREDTEIPLEDLTDEFLSLMATALPLYPNQKAFPLPGEIVLLFDLPSAPSPITNKTEETYYLSSINTWNSSQFNGVFLDNSKSVLYNSFNENGDFRGLQSFEGDYIVEGRFGNSIRFGSTNKVGAKDENPWSTNPTELGNSPILLLSNQHNYKLPGSDLHTEQINEDGASIYLTSNQTIPLNIKNIRYSNITSPIAVGDFVDPQVVVNADRVIVSSKSDEILLFGASGIELYSQGPVYMQSNKVGITLQDNQIFLGPYNSNIPTEPVVMGDQLKLFLSNLIQTLSNFSCNTIGTVSTTEGTVLQQLNSAAEGLQTELEALSTILGKSTSLLSQITKTA
jgi:hypothetical protein